MPINKGIRCSLVIENQVAQEYGRKRLDEATIKVSVVAISGARYYLEFDVPKDIPGSELLMMDCKADGSLLCHAVAHQGQNSKMKYALRKKKVMEQFEERELRFGDLWTDDDDAHGVKDDITVDELGVLEVCFYRRLMWTDQDEYESDDEESDEETDEFNDTLSQPIAEKLVKGMGITHTTKLGKGEVKQQNLTYSKEVDPPGEPYVRFLIRYRSKSLLQAEGTMPRTPSPDPNYDPEADDDEIDHDIANMTPAQMQRMLMEYRNGPKKDHEEQSGEEEAWSEEGEGYEEDSSDGEEEAGEEAEQEKRIMPVVKKEERAYRTVDAGPVDLTGSPPQKRQKIIEVIDLCDSD